MLKAHREMVNRLRVPLAEVTHLNQRRMGRSKQRKGQGNDEILILTNLTSTINIFIKTPFLKS
jgi:hypothetical protein